MDNNVLRSAEFDRIIDEIKELGFAKGATFINPKTKSRCNRYVDFNQGLDAKLMTEHKAARLGEIALRPARIAFDHIEDEQYYKRALELCAKHGIKYLSNYILYNGEDFTGKGSQYHADTPEDLYNRMRISMDFCDELNEKYGSDGAIHIFSFPMKYIPLHDLDRSYIGTNWNAKYLRAVQRMLVPTQGKGVSSRSFFIVEFGKDAEEFVENLAMPEDLLGLRGHFVERIGEDTSSRDARYATWIKNQKKIEEWRRLYREMSDNERTTFINIIGGNDFSIQNYRNCSTLTQKILFISNLSNLGLLKVIGQIEPDVLRYIFDKNNIIYLYFSQDTHSLTYYDNNGNPQYNVPIIGSATPLGTIITFTTAGKYYDYAMKITQYWGSNAENSVVQNSMSVFKTRTYPTLLISGASGTSPHFTSTAIAKEFTATYYQPQGDTVSWVKWQMAHIVNGNRIMLDDTGCVPTQDLSYLFTGFVNGESYAVNVTVETSSGKIVESGWKTITVSYSTTDTNDSLLTYNADDSITVDENSARTSIPGTASANFGTFTDGKLSLASGKSVTWNTQDDNALSIPSPWTIAWKGTFRKLPILAYETKSALGIATQIGHTTTTTQELIGMASTTTYTTPNQTMAGAVASVEILSSAPSVLSYSVNISGNNYSITMTVNPNYRWYSFSVKVTYATDYKYAFKKIDEFAGSVPTAINAVKGVSGTVTLASASWSGTTYTLSVAALGANDAIFFSPVAAADKTALETANIIISASTGTVTFTAQTAPTTDIALNYFIARGAA